MIEKARGAEIAMSIQQNKDLGCQASQVITITEDKITCTKSQSQKFWNYLGAENEEDIDGKLLFYILYKYADASACCKKNINITICTIVIDGGHPDEDELYETFMIDTNMVYEIKDEELVPLETYWGTIPKIEMLDPNKVGIYCDFYYFCDYMHIYNHFIYCLIYRNNK